MKFAARVCHVLSYFNFNLLYVYLIFIFLDKIDKYSINYKPACFMIKNIYIINDVIFIILVHV